MAKKGNSLKAGENSRSTDFLTRGEEEEEEEEDRPFGDHSGVKS